jgi:hypothetical protein
MTATTHPRRIAAATLLALAAAAPPAMARPILDPPIESDLSAPPPIVEATDESFAAAYRVRTRLAR